MQTETAKFECQNCRGTGKVQIGYVNIRLVNCRACKGRGSFNTDEETRMAARAKAREARDRKIESAHNKAAAFLEERTDIAQWFESATRSRNEGFAHFAQSVKDALYKFGSLTPGQLAAVENSILKYKARVAERETQAAEPKWTPPFAENLMKAFKHAQASGLKRLGLHILGIGFTLAKETSRNPGCIYLKDDSNGLYLGKITPELAFFPSRDCQEQHHETLRLIGEDIMAAAKLHGQQTGICSCCNAELTNPESIALGIGPICREKWGF